MKTLSLPFPDSVAAAVGIESQNFVAEAQMALAMKLFELGRLTSGQAAELAGVGRIAFLFSCRRYQCSSESWDEDELKAEFAPTR